MQLSRLFSIVALAVKAGDALRIHGAGGRPMKIIMDAERRDTLNQNIVTWDEQSLFIHGERIMIFSGEFHPFRLPVPSLYLDVFQKIKALGYNTVSFYVDWALLEGKQGNFTAEGIFDLKPFFDAALNAGIYLIARPGPYINAEASGGGFPGWLQRVKGVLRTLAPDYLAATDNYMTNICNIIAKAQITNGGPVILFQVENEYSSADPASDYSPAYMQYVIDQVRNASIVIPLVNNDAWAAGNDAPGTGTGAVDIYGHDAYPLGFDCGTPTVWPPNSLATDYHSTHVIQSPTTPYSLMEFQGGSFDAWGGWGFEQCAALINQEFERVFYKNNFAAGVTIFNIYMTYGGTNWGNLGHPGGYTSYDYGAVIKEDRTVVREKYSEAKLEAQFLKVSPNYMLATPGTNDANTYTNTSQLTVTPLTGNGTGSFFIVRHTDYTAITYAPYKLKLPTSAGTLTIPQLGGSLTLNGRDSKIHVVDYPVGNITLLYSTAEIFTWKKFEDRVVLVVYGGLVETHELAVQTNAKPAILEGEDVKIQSGNGTTVLQFQASERKVVQVGDLHIYMLNRNDAYNYWVPDVPGTGLNSSAYGTSLMNPEAIVISGGYLVRSISTQNDTLDIKADFNQTTTLELIGVPSEIKNVVVNGDDINATTNDLGNLVVQPIIPDLNLTVPDLKSLDWRYIDSLPEIQPGYNDSAWPSADHETTDNSAWPLKTPVSLYGSDYGFHPGPLIIRGYFSAKGTEKSLSLATMGGLAYASSVWLNNTFLGSFKGNGAADSINSSYELPKLQLGQDYVLTVLVDSNGFDENGQPGEDEMKRPRGVLDVGIVSDSGSPTSFARWKITGNLGGEDYADQFRGPLNEGGFFFERQGYHLPSPPLEQFVAGSPYDGVSSAGVAFYTAPMRLDYNSSRFDIPISFVFDDISTSGSAYRAQLYVNGFQFGKYASNIGPQTVFPVPEGILDYQGKNWIGLAVWALEEGGAKLPGFALEVGTPVFTGRETVEMVQGPKYAPRRGAY